MYQLIRTRSTQVNNSTNVSIPSAQLPLERKHAQQLLDDGIEAGGVAVQRYTSVFATVKIDRMARGQTVPELVHVESSRSEPKCDCGECGCHAVERRIVARAVCSNTGGNVEEKESRGGGLHAMGTSVASSSRRTPRASNTYIVWQISNKPHVSDHLSGIRAG